MKMKSKQYLRRKKRKWKNKKNNKKRKCVIWLNELELIRFIIFVFQEDFCLQERDLRLFRDRLRQQEKILKQEVGMLPKSQRKPVMKQRQESFEKYQMDKVFLLILL